MTARFDLRRANLGMIRFFVAFLVIVEAVVFYILLVADLPASVRVLERPGVSLAADLGFGVVLGFGVCIAFVVWWNLQSRVSASLQIDDEGIRLEQAQGEPDGK